MKSNQLSNEKTTIKILSLRIYKRIVQELGLKPIELEPNLYNPDLVCWIFAYDQKIADIIEDERQRKNGGK